MMRLPRTAISYPTPKTLLHKITISPSETKIAYMKVANAGRTTNASPEAYSRAVIAYADFDAENLAISNEVGLGVHPETALGRRYRDVLGRVNQAWAAVADRSLLLVAGRAIPLDDPWEHLS